MAVILLVNGPNLNLLGEREPEIYGTTTLAQITQSVEEIISKGGHQLKAFQSNHEGELIQWMQQHRQADFLLINAAAFTHTSVALRDAIKLGNMPFIEIHLSNNYNRETFRKHSKLIDIAKGTIAGLGPFGYSLAAQYAVHYLSQHG